MLHAQARGKYTSLGLFLGLAIAQLAACARDPYRTAGCAATHPLPPLPAVEPIGAVEHGIICEVDDSATQAPDCDAIAAIYRRTSTPSRVFGVVVVRSSHEESLCTGAYPSAGARLSDLPFFD